MRFLLPQGIGDSIWGMTKVQDITRKLGNGEVEIMLNTQNSDFRENRAVDFIQRFKFVKMVGQYKTPITKPVYPPVDKDGYYVYLDSGRYDLDSGGLIEYVLIPNYPLERGIRLEEWMPEFETNWKIMDEYRFEDSEIELRWGFQDKYDDYCVFYLGPESANTHNGHNRGPIWKPEDWQELGRLIKEKLHLNIVLVGAYYDMPYYLTRVEPLVRDQGWVEVIGTMQISETFSIVKGARFVISFQSGIGIVAEYMGIPAGLFWRQKGDSISPDFFLSFDEKMNGAWSPPEMISSGKHMALYYGRHSPEYIMQEILRRGW